VEKAARSRTRNTSDNRAFNFFIISN
jgi:hypothetical protein